MGLYARLEEIWGPEYAELLYLFRQSATKLKGNELNYGLVKVNQAVPWKSEAHDKVLDYHRNAVV
jgi:hypothetical protein